MNKPYRSTTQPMAVVSPPDISIQSPGNGDTVAPAFQADGGVSDGVTDILVTLQSSKPGVLAVGVPCDGSSGFWSADFNVNPADYPGDSTLTAAIAGTDVSNTITIKIVAPPAPTPVGG